MVYNLNFNWKFKRANVPFPLKDASESIKENGKSFFDPLYDDSTWESVSLPHAPNASESFDSLIRDAGEATLYRGFMFYRKKFSLNKVSSKKFFLEFEAVRQTVYIYVNGTFAGYYEHGTAPIGFDISPFVKMGENIVAIATDNAAYRECDFVTIETVPGNTPGDCSGVRHQWNQKDFNEVQGGITGNVNLYEKPLLYLTLPLYSNLKTTGCYITATDFGETSAKINIKAEIRNETDEDCISHLEITVSDEENKFSFKSEPFCVPSAKDKGVLFKTVVSPDVYSENPLPTDCETTHVYYRDISFNLENIALWNLDFPHLYNVKISLVSATGTDTQTITTGFREVTYDIKNGLMINKRSIFLTGYAQRSTNEWAAIGVAPDWLTDFDMELVRKSGGNYIRWMHVTPKPAAIRSGDKYAVVSVCPAGDKEADQQGRYWNMRVEAMRDAIIYFRNSPSVIFYEAGNAAISPEHMREMTNLKKRLDPSGYRFMGCRSLTTPEQIKEAEWVGTMVYRYDAHAKRTMDELNYYIPMLETEYKRDESPRRIWDDFSPPHFDYMNKWLGDGAKKTDGYDVWDQTQEEFARFAASDKDGYAYFFNNRVGGSTKNNYYSGSAIMVWSDSNMHGRNSGSENCRTTGKVDPVRIEKQAFYALRVMQSHSPAVHIIGHWNYPADRGENYNYFKKEWNGTYFEKTNEVCRRNPHDKTVYVVGSLHVYKVELYINGSLKGTCSTPEDNYIFPFPHIDITEQGYVEAIGYNENGEKLTSHRIETSGEKAKITLTPSTGPMGLLADGSDICFFDVGVTDNKGNICPLSYDRIDFTLSGDGVFLGGYNSGTYDASSVIGKNYCFAECGTNRVFVKSVPFGKSFTLTASAEGLESASVTINLTPIKVSNGFLLSPQQSVPENTFTCPDCLTPLKERSVSSSVTHEKEIYTVFVNDRIIKFETLPYRPDTSTGVLCPIRPILTAMGIAFCYNTTPTTTLFIPKYNLSLSQGETTIKIGNETSLTNAEFYVENGELIVEIAAIMAFIEGVEITTDVKNKRVWIKF